MKSEKRVKIRKRDSLIITSLFAIFALSVTVGCASAATYTVCPSGCDYTRIQAAIEAADLCDTLEVHSGTYYEHVNVNKQLILKGVGTGSGKPVVDSGGNDSAITLSANGITFEGFTVTNSGKLRGDVGIKVTSNNNTITGNTASNNGHGIYLNDSCNNNITGNTVSNNDCGIYLFDSYNNTITSNNASNNGYGTRLRDSSNNNISGNTVSNNGYGTRLRDSSNNNISGNTVSNNGDGIYINDSCNNNTILGNIASNNGVGIYLRYSCNNSITSNNASNNGNGICLRYSCGNTISGNNASNNRDGIHLFCSGNNNITANTFVNDGLFVGEPYQNAVEGNIVNGKPLVYLVDTSDIAVTDAGQVILVNCSNITVENLDLSNASVGVEFWETEDSIISNNNVSNNWYGIRLKDSSNNIIASNTASNNNYGIRLRDSSNNIIANNTASNNNWYGIRLRDSSNNTISGNNVSNNGFYGIHLMDSCNNTISGNTFVNDGLDVAESYKNVVENNTVNGKPLVYLEEASGIGVTDAGQVILVNCTNITVENLDLSNTSVCVELWETEDSMISNNSVSNSFRGIRLSYSNSNIIRCNDVSNNWYGIVLSDSSNNTISGNTTCNSDEDGFYISHSSNNTLSGNTACNSDDDGIHISHSSNNTISGNNASNNGNGICLFDSHNNTIPGNNASNNCAYGICLVDSNNNTIRGNTANNNNWYGIRPGHSSNNKIYLNNFINNTNNVYSFNLTNIWNSTDEITYTYNGRTHTNYLGNYWSDYKEKYPNAKEICGCGIWDMQYSINSDNDTYPLIQPWENYFAPAASIFDTGTGTYPSIMGTHTGTITPSSSINVSKLYTYSCAETGGHIESIELEENGTVIANGTGDGYHEDWHNLTLYNVTDGTHYVTLLQDHEYSYTIRTGSYPQILHAASKEVTGGTITCTSFVDANGKRYSNRIPAIRLE